jgi:hypothetical protein
MSGTRWIRLAGDFPAASESLRRPSVVSNVVGKSRLFPRPDRTRSTLYERQVEEDLGIATVLAGTPLYVLWRRLSSRSHS